MVFETILYAAAFLGLSAGALADIKTKEVPDWISYSLIFSGLGLRLIYSLAGFNWTIFFEGLVGFLIFVVLGYLFYYLGQWGGGDAKLMMGMGAIIGLGFDLSSFPRLAEFLINLAAVGTVYGLLWLGYLAMRNKNQFLEEFKEKHRKVRSFGIILGVLGLALVIGSFFVSGVWKGMVLVFSIIPVGTMYLWLLTSSIEKVSFYKKVEPKDLTEGDWIARKVMVDGEKIAGPKDLGITGEQISKLIRLKKEKKVDKILVKEGIPFVPSFLIAFLVTIFLENWWMGLIF